LQSAEGLIAERASAIDELFIDSPDFGYVRVSRNRFAISEPETNGKFGVLSQLTFEFGKCHNAQSGAFLHDGKFVCEEYSVNFARLFGVCAVTFSARSSTRAKAEEEESRRG
jgi:hypothetical protein